MNCVFLIYGIRSNFPINLKKPVIQLVNRTTGFFRYTEGRKDTIELLT